MAGKYKQRFEAAPRQLDSYPAGGVFFIEPWAALAIGLKPDGQQTWILEVTDLSSSKCNSVSRYETISTV
jgi:hypothetical protein